jgi:hypothetical protein
VTVEIDVSRNTEPSIVCSDAGRQIDVNDAHHSSAEFSILVSFDPDSNVNDKSETHLPKELDPRNSTEEGIQIDINVENPARAKSAN